MMDARRYFMNIDSDDTAANDATAEAGGDDTPGRQRGKWRIGLLCAVALACALGAVLLPPLAQPVEYHAFADARTLLGIPNFWNVATNLAILAAGIAGLRATVAGERARLATLPLPHPVRAPVATATRDPYVLLCGGFVLTALGSTYYHLAPDSDRLVWDRLPMTLAFMSLLAAMIAERIDARTGARLLLPLVAIGGASVLWWRWTIATGAQDVGPYAIVQFGSIVLVLLIAALFPSRVAGHNRAVFAAGVLYALAKVCEHFDDRLFALGSLLSGHSVKHLLVGAACFQLVRLARRDA
jgi:hypothetical protein